MKLKMYNCKAKNTCRHSYFKCSEGYLQEKNKIHVNYGGICCFTQFVKVNRRIIAFSPGTVL